MSRFPWGALALSALLLACTPASAQATQDTDPPVSETSDGGADGGGGNTTGGSGGYSPQTSSSSSVSSGPDSGELLLSPALVALLSPNVDIQFPTPLPGPSCSYVRLRPWNPFDPIDPDPDGCLSHIVENLGWP